MKIVSCVRDMNFCSVWYRDVARVWVLCVLYSCLRTCGACVFVFAISAWLRVQKSRPTQIIQRYDRLKRMPELISTTSDNNTVPVYAQNQSHRHVEAGRHGRRVRGRLGAGVSVRLRGLRRGHRRAVPPAPGTRVLQWQFRCGKRLYTGTGTYCKLDPVIFAY